MSEKLLKAFFIIAAAVVCHEICIFVHELGHLIMGLLSGYSFLSFRVASFVIVRQNGSWKLKRQTIAGTGGQCLMVPPDSDEPEKVPAMMYHFGGGLFNILTVLITLPFALKAENLYAGVFLYMMIIISVSQILMNLVPMKLPLPNDGYNMMLIRRSIDDRIAMYNILRMKAYSDQRPSRMPEKLFVFSEEGEYSRISKLMYASRLLDEKQIGEAEEVFRECARKDDRTPGEYYRLEAACGLLFCLLTERAPVQEIEQVYDEELKKYIAGSKKHQMDKHVLLYAYEHLSALDEEAAQKEYAEVLRLAKENPDRGDAEMYLSLLTYAAQC